MPEIFIGGKIYDMMSALAHELVFDNGIMINANKGLAEKVKAIPEEKAVFYDCPQLVTSVFNGDSEVQKWINSLFNKNVVIITSLIGAQAYKLTVSPVTTIETSRLPPKEKICYHDKWNTFTTRREFILAQTLL
jgi:hypothetical protein